LAWLAGAAVVLAMLSFVPVDLKVRGAFRALPGHNADVRALVDGIVAKVNVHEGYGVRAGDVLARLAPRDMDTQLGEVNADIDQAEARLRLLLAGPRPADVAVARAALKTVEGHLPYAQDRLTL